MKIINKPLLPICLSWHMYLVLFFGTCFLGCENSGSLLAVDSEAPVTKVVLLFPDEQATHLERDQNHWMLNNTYKANEEAVFELLYWLEGFAIRRPVSIADKQAVNEQMKAEGILVEVYEKTHWIRLPFNTSLIEREKLHRAYVIGGRTSDQEGTYIRMANSEKIYEVHIPGTSADIQETLKRKAHLWRDPTVFDLEAHQIKSIKVHIPGNTDGSFLLIRDQDQPGGVQIFDASGTRIDVALLDTIRLERYIYLFKGKELEQFLTGEDLQNSLEEIIEPSFMELTVCDNEGHCVKLSCFHRPNRPDSGTLYVEDLLFDPNRFYVKIDDRDYAIVQFYVFNRILRPLSFFLRNTPNSN